MNKINSVLDGALSSLKKRFFGAWMVAHPVQDEVSGDRLYPVVDIPIEGSELTVSVQDSILARVLKACGGAFVQAREGFLGLQCDDALESIGGMVTHLKENRRHMFPGKMRVVPEFGQAPLMATINCSVSSAIKKVLGISLKVLVIFKGVIQRRSHKYMRRWILEHVSKHVDVKMIDPLLAMAERGVVFVTPDTLKNLLGQKLFKLGKYCNTPLQSGVLMGVEFYVLPNSINMDGCALTSRYVDKEMKIAVDTMKVIGIGSWDGELGTLFMDIYLHKSGDAYLKNKGARGSLSLLTKARWMDMDKPLTWLKTRATEFAAAVSTGDHHLARYVMSRGVAPEEGEDHRKFSATLQGVMDALREVDSTQFGSMLEKARSMIYPLIRGLITRGVTAGRFSYSVPEHLIGALNVILPTCFKGKGFELGDKIIIARHPVFPDTVVTVKVVGFEGDSIRVNPILMGQLGGDFDGDIVVVYPDEVFGLVRNLAWRPEDEICPPEVVHEDENNDVGHLRKVCKVTKPVADMLIQVATTGYGFDSLMIGRATQLFRRFQEGFLRLGIFYRDDVQYFLRGMKLHFLQSFLDGIKHSVRKIDYKASVFAFTDAAKKIDPKFTLRPRSLLHMIASESFNRKQKGGRTIVVVDTNREQLIGGLDELGCVNANTGEVDMDKLMSIAGNHHRIDRSDPFLRAIFEPLVDMKLGTPENHIHNKAREMVKTDPIMHKVAERIGINPITGRQAALPTKDGKQLSEKVMYTDGVMREKYRSMICRAMDIWQSDKRAHANMETSQQKVAALFHTGAHVFSKEFGVALEEMQVMIMICIISYTSSNNKGLYGGLSGFDPRVLACARRVIDRSWLYWLATVDVRKEEENEKILGAIQSDLEREEKRLNLTPGTLSIISDRAAGTHHLIKRNQHVKD